MSLKSVKTKIKSIDKTRQVTRAMEAVSAVKMRKSQHVALAARPYALSAMQILRAVTRSVDALGHPLLLEKQKGKALVIIISADKGLAGSYGSTLMKTVYKFFDSQKLRENDLLLATVGKKATEHFKKRKYEVIFSCEKLSDQVSHSDVAPLAQVAREAFLFGDARKVFIIYTNFISTLKQETVVRELLPVSLGQVEKMIHGITPERGLYSEADDVSELNKTINFSFEPSPESVVQSLVESLFQIQLYHSVLEANASEHSSRMIAMKNASDNAGEISRQLKLKYNKARQAAITKEVSEIVGGMESMRVIN